MAGAHVFTQFLFLLFALGLFRIIQSTSDLDPRHRQLSFGKQATQSSTEGSHVASLVTDGNFNDDDANCTKTTISDNPSIEVDLGTDTFVDNVAITFPGSQQTFTNLRISFTNSEESNTITPVEPSDTKNAKCYSSPSRAVRYIRITREEASSQLSVCEITAYSRLSENLAMYKPTYSSSFVTYGYPSRLVNLEFATKVMTRNEQSPWVKTDLKHFYFVHEIFLLPVLGANNVGTMSDLNIRIGTDDTNFNKNPLCAIEELHVGEGKSFYCNMFGQIISIQRTSKAAIHMSEMLVNPINPISIQAKGAVSNTPNLGGKGTFKAIDLKCSGNWFITHDMVQEKTLTVELDGEFHIVMIYLAASGLRQFALTLDSRVCLDGEWTGIRYKLTIPNLTGLQLQGNFAECLPGLHDVLDKGGYYFFCVKRTLAKYVMIRQFDKDRQMRIGEVFIFEETRPGLSYNKKYNKYVWGEENKDVTLSCDLDGYPTPVWSWVKNKTVVDIGSRSLTLLHVKKNESYTYECWANNTHGYDAMKVTLSVSSKWCVCADHGEMVHDLKTASAVGDSEIRGDQWQSIFDNKQMKHLQFREKAPKSTSSCQLWLNRKHPTLEDGIVSGMLCLKNATHDCATTFDVDIRRCSAFYIYHFATLGDTSAHKFCFEPATITPNGHPSISQPLANSALSDKILQRETQVAESYKCLIMCQVDPSCKSFNFSQKYKICELNTGTRKEFPRNFGPRNHYSYFQMNSGTVKAARRRGEL